jgi:hypothetical protein
MWWGTPVIPAIGRLKQVDRKFKESLSLIVRHCLTSKNDNNKTPAIKKNHTK